MSAVKIRLEQFGKEDYANLVSWVDGEETLMQFAGPLFTFPLTAEQLDVSLSDKNRAAFKIVNTETNLIIGHAEIYWAENSAKIGRILVGNQQQRGRGLGQQIVGLLLNLAFSNLGISIVELNVFDWNIGAIKCYEKAGFTVNPGKKLERKIKDETWTALNMVIDRLRHENKS